MGKIISVTIPLPLVEHLQREADIIGISRSRFISNILLKWQEDRKEVNKKSEVDEESINDCDNRGEEGHCEEYQIICDATQPQAETCEGYYHKDSK